MEQQKKPPGVRALILLAQLVGEVDEATKNPMLAAMLRRSEKGQQVLKQARAILADAREELRK